MKTVFVEPNQNIFDICLQEYGNLNHLILLHTANGFEECPHNIKPGDEIIIPDALRNEPVVAILQKKKPATHNELVLEQVAPDGIDYWAIEVDFVVS